MSQPTDARRRGSIRQRGSSLQVRLFAGKDPVTGRDIYFTASIQGTDKKAWKKAEDKLSEFRSQVNRQRSTPSSVSLGYAIDEWMRVSEHEETTAHGYRGWKASTPSCAAVGLCATGGRPSITR
ncbi:hypothetical protein [Gandjariella thermophila]|uniref:Integrase SAM-like N-terminal domain-containing protein n=1 Tax=Gandjariella thermophila TaxID=1931992 RepID=A0A4D4J3M1_9PSEU|nr:hypothetical protein [Gandjariella thermophila]GDY31101.1 hypothetical protein GTS_27340 [Gandjariella thermophila]